MDILTKIQKDYLSFSKQEKKIADYILRFNQELQNMNITDLSEKTGTSNSSITRFVKKVGCKNYSDMKFSINGQSAPVENHKSNGIADEVFLYYQNVIKNTQHLIDLDKIKQFMKLLKEAKSIILIGASSSGTTAQILGIRLMRMGLPVKSYSDPNWMLMQASIASPGDLFVAISNSGVTRCIVETLEQARTNGATIVSITSFSENPVSKLSDLIFHVYNTRFVHNQKFANSQFSNIYLIDVITTYLMEDQQFGRSVTTTRQIINDL
ncbi:MurR/RpiR family transcriptional regulator [Lacrimispora sp.]|uniref:MurR/RpiR family transcriptional regulator n=1 Tax=Lacrimispora sp. TaxID=2719234 RepID=UPI0028A0FBD3|nr:MurR/RpiR family transcriptional regulator [Lacrimispora sp.]